MMASHRQVRRATSIRGLLILRVNNKVRVGASVSITTGGAGVFSEAQTEAAVVALTLQCSWPTLLTAQVWLPPVPTCLQRSLST